MGGHGSTRNGPVTHFHNPWPNSEPHGFGDLLRWARERRRQTLAPSPARGSFPTASPEISYPRGGVDEHTATWIGHSTVLLQIGGLNVLTDPVFSPRASPVQWAGPLRIMPPALPIELLPPLDVVAISHNHYDHLDRLAVKQIALANPEATWIAPLGLGRFIRRWGARRVVELDWWESARESGIGSGESRESGKHEIRSTLEITATPARHFSARWFGDRNRSLWCGYALEMNGFRAWFAGDTAYHPDFGEAGKRCGPFDFVMIPIGAYEPRWFMQSVHVNPEEAIQVYQDVTGSGPSPLMLAIHWGTFRLTDEPMEEPPKRTLERWRSVGLAEEKLWIARFGETRGIGGSIRLSGR